MELIYAIADELNIPNEFVIIDRAFDGMVWFHTKAGAKYSARTKNDGKYLRKNSIRPD